jgi:tetratricopeptide (TPR) repeat protein
LNRAEKRRQRKSDNKLAKAVKKSRSAENLFPHKSKHAIQQSVDLGIAHHIAGRLSEAERIYRQILATDPNNPVALHLLGVIAHRVGNHSVAVDLISKALVIKSDYIEAYINLGNVLKDFGRLEEAISNYQKALAINQNLPGVHYNLGNTLQEFDKLDEAVVSYRKALAIKPDYAEAHNNLGNALKQRGDLDEAVISCRKALAIKPDYIEAHINLGNALQKQNKQDEAVTCYQKAIAIQPDFSGAHYNLGNVLQELGELDEAVTSYQKALAIKPDYTEVYSNLCEIYEMHSMVPELEKTVSQAQAALHEDDPNLLYRMAQLASREKRFEDTRDYLERVNPESLSLEIRRSHSTLLAKTYDKLGQFSDAFTQFEITNELAKQTSESKQYSDLRYVDEILQLSVSWSRATKIKQPAIKAPEVHQAPVFLVGFPRSGTTLLDTILRSHPGIAVVEEKPIVGAMNAHLGSLATAGFLANLNDTQITDLREVYYTALHSYVDEADRHKVIIDKLPLNIIDVGLINRVFPDAKFILALRHPCDCVLSCFMQSFILNDAMSNFLTLQKSAALYDAVMTLWMQFNNKLDLAVNALKYEDLIQDLQGTVEPLLNFLALDWHDNLYNYQQTAMSRKKINTPSYNQVTENLYTGASGRWKNYQDQMKEEILLLKPWAKKFGY